MYINILSIFGRRAQPAKMIPIELAATNLEKDINAFSVIETKQKVKSA